MKSLKEIQKIISQFNVQPEPQTRSKVLDEALAIQRDQKRKIASGVSIWRRIMKSNITKFAAAAVIIIGVFIGIYSFNGSIDGARVAFAQIAENMKKMPWMHIVTEGMDQREDAGEVTSEKWTSFEKRVRAEKRSEGTIIFYDREGYQEFDPNTNTLTVRHFESDPLAGMKTPIEFVKGPLKFIEDSGGTISCQEGIYQGQVVNIYKISAFLDGHKMEIEMCVDKNKGVLLSSVQKGFSEEGTLVIDAQCHVDYPETGPADVYELGVPADARVVHEYPDKPDEQLKPILDCYQQVRAEATQQFISIVTYTSQLNDIHTVDVEYKMDPKHRLERHFVFRLGVPMKEAWPVHYKDKLGDSFESLLTWSRDHYHEPGFISIRLYDGEYNSFVRREDSTWGEYKKTYSPRHESMPNNRLEYLAWPFIGPKGKVIEDDYAKENGYICIERLQQGMIHSDMVSHPGRFVYYLDPERNYLCMRKITEWRPDADWQEEANWLDGVDPEKIRDGSITVEDITELVQEENGFWYPKTIEEKQSSICKDYREKPLKVTDVKRIYLKTDVEIPDVLFDSEQLPKDGD